MAEYKLSYTASEIDERLGMVDKLSNITVDSELSSTSENPIQNKAVNAEFSVVDNSINSLQTAVNNKSDITHNHDTVYDTKGSASDALDSAKSYTDTKTSDLVSTSTVNSKISTHNTSSSSHSDIRDLITELTTRLNALADSDDTTLDQMSEVVAYIKSNKELIESITTSKVNVSDIVNNLTTNSSTKPLSAAQGVAIKALIDALQTEVDTKAEASDLTSHTDNTSNPHSVTKSQVGLGNVPNVATNDQTPTFTQASSRANLTIRIGLKKVTNFYN